MLLSRIDCEINAYFPLQDAVVASNRFVQCLAIIIVLRPRGMTALVMDGMLRDGSA
jgi:hypothetical protein